jgi:hypothetical protein
MRRLWRSMRKQLGVDRQDHSLRMRALVFENSLPRQAGHTGDPM